MNPDVHELIDVAADGIRHYRDGPRKRLIQGRWVDTRAELRPFDTETASRRKRLGKWSFSERFVRRYRS